MKKRCKSTAPLAEPRRKTRGAREYHPRMLPKLRVLLEAGRDENEIAAWFGVTTKTLRKWANEDPSFREALDSREDIREWDEERNLRMAFALASRGATAVEIAQAFNVSPRTLTRWRQRCPEFDEALTMGIEAQVKVTEQTLFNVANGYVYEQERVITTKDGLTKVVEQKISHPNPAMLRLFLEANKPGKYRVNAKPSDEEDPLGELLEQIENREFGQVQIKYKDAG